MKEKVELFIKDIMKNSQEVIYPGNDISVNEMVVGFRGRWLYNVKKSAKYHIKIFGL